MSATVDSFRCHGLSRLTVARPGDLFHRANMKRAFDERTVRGALARSWSIRSAGQWTPENPAAGQCNVTAAVIHDLFGGEVLRTKLREGFHYYNRIDDRAIDLTDSQFAEPISYEDEVSSRDAALEGVAAAEFESLRSALMQNLGQRLARC